jgi:hypothetical protein
MLKLAVVVLAVVLAGSASAAGWRSLRVDASSEAAFKDSVALFQSKLSPSREHAFNRALGDIWTAGTEKAAAEQREYTSSDYFAQLDGLSYDDIVRVLDPTGHKGKQYRAEYYSARAGGVTFGPTPWPTTPGPASGIRGLDSAGLAQRQQQTGTLNPDRALGGIQY